jgi:hypothetical protein
MLFDTSGYQLTEIVDWIAQAQLFVLAQPGRFRVLAAAGYRTIFDLVRLLKQSGGPEALRQLWNLPAVNRIHAERIEAQADDKRLLQVYNLIGSTGS